MEKRLSTEVTRLIDEGEVNRQDAVMIASTLAALSDDLKASLSALRAFMADGADRNERFECPLGSASYKAGAESRPHVKDAPALGEWMRANGEGNLTVDVVVPEDDAATPAALALMMERHGVSELPGVEWSKAREATMAVKPLADWRSLMSDDSTRAQVMGVLAESFGLGIEGGSGMFVGSKRNETKKSKKGADAWDAI